MTGLWVSLAVVVALVLAWRIHRATKTLDRILREELDTPDRVTDRDEQSADQRNPQT